MISYSLIVTRFTNTGSGGAASSECLLKSLRISVFQGNVLQLTTIGSNFVLQTNKLYFYKENGKHDPKIKTNIDRVLLILI